MEDANLTPNVYCRKCGGILVGSIQITSDFFCQGHSANNNSIEHTPPFGWECPRCHTIHSPFKMSCDCAPPVVSKSSGETFCVWNPIGDAMWGNKARLSGLELECL